MADATAGSTATALPSEARLKALYSIMQSIENKLGGGEGVEGLYGSIKKSGMDKVLECMRDKCCLDSRSVLVDVGAGLGRPLMHALLEPGIAGARGIEIDRIKCDKAAAFLKQALAELRRRGVVGAEELTPPPIECSAIENVRCLDPCTHAYSFWEGVPVEGKAAFGSLFNASSTLRSVAVVQRAIRTCPLAYMCDLGFGELVLMGSFSVSMSGSGRSFTAYVFNKASLPTALHTPVALEQAAAQSVQTPAQAAQPAAAATSVGAVAAGAELEGESAQSRLAAAEVTQIAGAVMEEPVAPGRGQRQRKPSAKQQASVEQQQHVVAEQPSVEERRSNRRGAASDDAAAPDGRQQQPAALQAGASTATVPVSAPRLRTRSAARPAPAATTTAKSQVAAKLSSPQKGGVQKRTSPAKGASTASRSAQTAERGPAASRKLALVPPRAGKGSKGGEEAGAVPLAPGSGGLLQRAVRVVKTNVVDGVSKLRMTRQAAAARRGLQAHEKAA